MNLKKKLIFLLIFSGVFLALLFHGAFYVFMAPSLENQKIIFIETLRRRIDIALSFEKKSISILCANWAEWQSMALYVAHPTTKLEEDMFPDNIFGEDMMDLIIVANREQNILFSRAYKNRELLGADRLNISPIIEKLLSTMTVRMMNSGPVNCIIHSGLGPLILAVHPIKAGPQPKDAVGVLILGRFIHRRMISKISDYVMAEVLVRAFPFDKKRFDSGQPRGTVGKDLLYREKKGRLIIDYLLRDINGKPAVILHTETDNRMLRVVNRHIVTFIIITLLSIILLGLLLYFSIRRNIIRRMLRISGTMKQIEGLKDLPKRIEVDRGEDEISRLVTNINTMLDKLEDEKIKRERAEKTMITHGKLASIGRLTSCIGHEVNNPLLAVSNSIQVIKKINRSKSPLFREALEISESEIQRIRDIISSLLDFHRLEGEEFTRVDAAEVIRESLNVLKWSKKLGGTEVTQQLENGCFVHGSPGKLKQVFINFILNAVEAVQMSHEAGDSGAGTLRIRVTAGSEDRAGFSEIHFIDNGPGIPGEVKNYLFEPFVSTKTSKGVGLGLYISYKIIENHRGKIIYNEDCTQGTHFIIKLPKEKRAAYD